jgi:hypothetical protein
MGDMNILVLIHEPEYYEEQFARVCLKRNMPSAVARCAQNALS